MSDGEVFPRDYAHARHAGNHGDVLKHVALLAALRELARDPAPLLYVDSHAGDGLYPLGSAGEWGEGVSRVWDQPIVEAPATPLEAYRSLVARWSAKGAHRPRAYPGSPLLAQAILEAGARPQDELHLFELDAQAAGVLRSTAGADGRVRIAQEDGFAGAQRVLAAHPTRRALVLIDPPYSAKAEWTEVARAVPEIFHERPDATVLLWYPIKAMTRPVSLLNALAEAGVHGMTAELVATPLRLKREKLNGSGLALFRAPDAALRALCADLPALGTRLATRGEWTVRLFGF